MRQRKIFGLFLSISLVIAGIIILVIGLTSRKNQEDITTQTQNPATHHVEYDFSGQGEKKSKLLEHYEEKSDHVIGRMFIPDTAMETPIVDSDYYFRRNLDGAYDAGGVPFTVNPETFNVSNKNCTIYGHRLEDGTDFGILKEYLDQDFYNAHKTISIETDTGVSEWEIISVFTINIAEDSFAYHEYYDMSDNASRGNFLNEIRTRNQIHTKDYTFQNGDKLITLSTCHYETDKENGRLVVVAVNR